MKKKQRQELATKSITELKKQTEEWQKELVQLRIDLGAGKLKDVNQVKKKRQDLARVKTVLRAKELVASEKRPKEEKREEKEKVIKLKKPSHQKKT